MGKQRNIGNVLLQTRHSDLVDIEPMIQILPKFTPSNQLLQRLIGSCHNSHIDWIQAVTGTSPFDGVDILNLGSDGIDGNDIVMFTVGGRYEINRYLSFGASYERPLTRRKDIIQQRFTLSLVFEL